MSKTFKKLLIGFIIITLNLSSFSPFVSKSFSREASPSSTLSPQNTSPSPALSPTPTIAPLTPAPATELSPSPLPSPSQPGNTPEISPPQVNSPTVSPAISAFPSLLPSVAVPSAFIRKPLKIFPLSRKFYQSNQPVTASYLNDYEDKVKISLSDSDGRELPVILQKEIKEGETFIKILPPHSFRPGRYTLKIADDKNNTTVQDFTWGVLAINPNKAVYNPGETAKIAIGVLDEKGVTVCNALVSLDITSPSGQKTSLGTWDRSVKVNSVCGTKNVSYIPDYESEYAIADELGTYNLALTAETRNGKYSVTDAFEVNKDMPFDIERLGATRIFPINQYYSLIKIKANRDFEGRISEEVPPDFEISPVLDNKVISYNQISTSSALLKSDSVIIGNSFTDLPLPLKNEFPLTQSYGNIPDNSWLRQEYERGGSPAHDGIDFAVPMNTPVYSIDDGTVFHAGLGPYGKTVIINHSWGRSYYGHLNEFKIKIGDTVKKGNLLALSGTTGLSTGPHLHLSVRPMNVPKENGFNGAVDPLKFLTKANPQKDDSVLTRKIITWNISISDGEEVIIGYRYKAPSVSPRFYLLGPLSFETPAPSGDLSGLAIPQSPLPGLTADNPLQPSSSSALPEIASESATPATDSSHSPNYQLLTTNYQLIYGVSRRWQIAVDADATITTEARFAIADHKEKGKMVFISDQVGYFFYSEGDAGDGLLSDAIDFSKTTDGGATWTDNTELFESGSNCCFLSSAWYDQWTPGDTTGTIIHIAFLNVEAAGADEVWYIRLDTSDDSFTSGAAITTSSTLTRGDIISITKGIDNTLFIGLADQGGGATVESCTSGCTGGESNWSTVGTPGLDAQQDPIRLMPLANNGIIMIRDDISGNKFDYKTWDGTNWSGSWTNIDTSVPDDPNHLVPWGVALRRWNNNIYLSYIDEITLSTADVKTAVFDGSSWTIKTDVVTDQNTLINSDIMVDEESGDIYVVYLYGTSGDPSATNIFAYKSTDGMTTWTALNGGSALNTSNADGDNRYSYLNIVDSERVYFAYYLDSGDYFGGTIANLIPPTLDEVLKHGEWWSKAGGRKNMTF